MMREMIFSELSGIVSAEIYMIIVFIYTGAAWFISRKCKGRLAEAMTNKKNRKWFFISWLFGLLLLTYFLLAPNISLGGGMTMVLLYILLAAEVVYSVHHTEWPVCRFLKAYEAALKEGKAYEAIEEFSAVPWYLTEPEERALYTIQRAYNYVLVDKYMEAYELYEAVDTDYLYPKQKRELNRQKANCLYLLGALGRAEHLLELEEGNGAENDKAMCTMLKGLIQMEKGNYKEARRLLLRALNCADAGELSGAQMASIYNNLGANVSVRNPEEALEYYEQARRIVRECIDAEEIHVIYNNLIHTYIRLGYDESVIQSVLKEYMDAFDHNTIQSRLEIGNLQLNMAREQEDVAAIHRRIETTYRELLECAGGEITSRAAVEISTWRMAVNAHMPLERLREYAGQILMDFPRYQTLGLMERLNAYKELIIPITSICVEIGTDCMGRKQAVPMLVTEPFASLAGYILEYYKAGAQEDILQQMNSLRDVQVNERCALMEHLLHIYRMVRPDIYLKELDRRFLSEIRRARDDDNYLKAVDYEMKRIDAFSGSENLDINFEPKNKEEIHRWLDECTEDLMKVEMSPAIAEHYLNLALRLAFMKRYREAAKWKEKFDGLHISIMHFTEVLQQQKAALDRILAQHAF